MKKQAKTLVVEVKKVKQPVKKASKLVSLPNKKAKLAKKQEVNKKKTRRGRDAVLAEHRYMDLASSILALTGIVEILAKQIPSHEERIRNLEEYCNDN